MLSPANPRSGGVPVPRDSELKPGVTASGVFGHNGGPPLQEPIGKTWGHFCWQKAHKAAWKTPPREVALRRLARAEELGMSYAEYTAIILDRGKHL